MTSIRLLSSSLESWPNLEPRSDLGRKQLYIKGRKLPAGFLWGEVRQEGRSVEDVADDWNLAIDVVEEAVRYGDSHHRIIIEDAVSERRFLEERGYRLEPPPASR